jgi:hypothetical protein
MGGALLDRRGVLASSAGVVEMQTPDLLVCLATDKQVVTASSARETLLQLHFGLPALQDACLRRSARLEDVLAWCWGEWSQSVWHSPPATWLKSDRAGAGRTEAPQLWRAAGNRVFSRLDLRDLDRVPEVYRWLSLEGWTGWLAAWAKEPNRYLVGAEAFRWIPEHMALEAWRSGLITTRCHDAARLVWERMPMALFALADELVAQPPRERPDEEGGRSPLMSLLYFAPDEHCEALVRSTGTWVGSPEEYPGAGEWLYGWLHRVVDRRQPGWRVAFDLLAARHFA